MYKHRVIPRSLFLAFIATQLLAFSQAQFSQRSNSGFSGFGNDGSFPSRNPFQSTFQRIRSDNSNGNDQFFQQNDPTELDTFITTSPFQNGRNGFFVQVTNTRTLPSATFEVRGTRPTFTSREIQTSSGDSRRNQFDNFPQRPSPTNAPSVPFERDEGFERQRQSDTRDGGFERQRQSDTRDGGFERQRQSDTRDGGFERQRQSETRDGGFERQRQNETPTSGPGLLQEGSMTESCLACICQASSSCNLTTRCVMGGQYCGPFLISQPYWTDSGRPTLFQDDPNREGAFSDCAMDPVCAAQTVRNYMNKYQKDCTGDGVVDCEDLARIHLMGPFGTECASPRVPTTPFYTKFSKCWTTVKQLS